MREASNIFKPLAQCMGGRKRMHYCSFSQLNVPCSIPQVLEVLVRLRVALGLDHRIWATKLGLNYNATSVFSPVGFEDDPLSFLFHD